MESPEETQYGCLIASCCEASPSEPLALEILGQAHDAAAVVVSDGISSQSWPLETKYYTADIPLHWCDRPRVPADESVLSRVHGVVLVCHPDQLDSGLEQAEDWLSHCEDPQVVLLAIPAHPDEEEEEPPRLRDWCLKRQCELVQWGGTEGVGRIREALGCHQWPQLKRRPPAVPPRETSVGELPSSFEELFAHFRDLKEKARGLTGEERKDFAERVAVQFWKACGGDDEEEVLGSND